MSKTKLMISFSFHFLQVEFVETNAVNMVRIVPVEVHNYLMANSAAFLAMLAAVELKKEKWIVQLGLPMIMTKNAELNVQYQHWMMSPFQLFWTIMNAKKILSFPNFLAKFKDLRISRSIVIKNGEKLVNQVLALLNSNSAIQGKSFKHFNSYFITTNVIQ